MRLIICVNNTNLTNVRQSKSQTTKVYRKTTNSTSTFWLTPSPIPVWNHAVCL